MKKFSMLLAGLGSATAAIPMAAQAAPWQPVRVQPAGYQSAQWQTINQRQANLYNRIEQGVRSGALNRAEATRLRNEFAALNRLEANYRRSRPGLTQFERRDRRTEISSWSLVGVSIEVGLIGDGHQCVGAEEAVVFADHDAWTGHADRLPHPVVIAVDVD